jgi:hypothetical protein
MHNKTNTNRIYWKKYQYPPGLAVKKLARKLMIHVHVFRVPFGLHTLFSQIKESLQSVVHEGLNSNGMSIDFLGRFCTNQFNLISSLFSPT